MSSDKECNRLARRIADLAPTWPQPGMACRDPETGWLCRFEGDYAATPPVNRWFVLCAAVTAETSPAVDRAIAAGPDWRDATTLGALLLGLSDEVEVDSGDLADHWCCRWWTGGEQKWAAGPTRPSAILRAVVARLEANRDGGAGEEAVTRLDWAKEDAPDEMTWEDANKYAKSLGNGWRLPTRAELVALYDFDQGRSIGMAADWYWSGTQPPGAGGRSAWSIFFGDGDIGRYAITDADRVRCVREVPRD